MTKKWSRVALNLMKTKKKKKIILKFNYIPEIHTYGISSKNTQLPNKKKGLPILHKFERKKT